MTPHRKKVWGAGRLARKKRKNAREAGGAASPRRNDIRTTHPRTFSPSYFCARALENESKRHRAA
jgi:hypothetical protein